MAPTSYPMALAVLVPLPFDIISTVLRFWIRYKRKAWGPDDWAMLINIVRFLDLHSLFDFTDIDPAVLECEHNRDHWHGMEWNRTV